ncbi:hypothetical protein, partial [Vibrio cholerae]|uniref:hypothetical protein n=1 Tax=Vibrio cholerae TaxID=666 RepID=UPI00301B84CD
NTIPQISVHVVKWNLYCPWAGRRDDAGPGRGAPWLRSFSCYVRKQCLLRCGLTYAATMFMLTALGLFAFEDLFG